MRAQEPVDEVGARYGFLLIRQRRIAEMRHARPTPNELKVPGSGTETVRSSIAKYHPIPSAPGWRVPPAAEKSSSVVGPKLKVWKTRVVVSTAKLTVPIVVPKSLPVTVITSPSVNAPAKFPLSSVNGLPEVMLSTAHSTPPAKLKATFGELVNAVPYPEVEQGTIVALS